VRVTQYIRRHHIGLIALFVAMTGTAYAGTQVVGHPTKPQTLKTKKKKKAKRGPAGPAGPAGPQGPKGNTGQAGNPADSPAAGINTGVLTLSGLDPFGTPSGASIVSATEGDVQTLTPAGSSITARDLAVRFSSSIDSPKTAIVTLRLNGANTALSCAVPGGGSTCQDSSHAVTIPPNSRISLQFVENGPGTCCPSRMAFGWRAVP
jgi:hypothetical protein